MSGVEVLRDKEVLGITPTKVMLVCDVETKLSFRKARFVTTTRVITPKPDVVKPLKINLAKVTFTVKVSSSPTGATILLGSRSLGVTPATVKLPAFETSTLKFQKEGYAPDTQKITPKQNNLSVGATLKKLGRRPAR